MKLFNKKTYPAHLEEENLSFGKQFLIFSWEIFKVVVISLAIIIPVRYFLIKPFYVKGASMEPNFYDHEYLIVDEITYRFEEPKRGDTVVFKYPFDTTQHFIKRVIGLPNEKIRIADGEVAIFDNQKNEYKILDESYLLPGMKTLGDFEVTLGGDEYYLLGDNRIASLDSRAFGPVKREFIVGRTLLRGWPPNRLGVVTSDFNYGL